MAINVKKSFLTDLNAEVKGAAVKFMGEKLVIARAGNPKYSRMLGTLVEKHKAELNQKDEAADALSDQILIDVMAETILLGWADGAFEDDNGKPIPYSVNAAREQLAVKDFRREISKLSDDIDNFRVKQEEKQVKN